MQLIEFFSPSRSIPISTIINSENESLLTSLFTDSSDKKHQLLQHKLLRLEGEDLSLLRSNLETYLIDCLENILRNQCINDNCSMYTILGREVLLDTKSNIRERMLRINHGLFKFLEDVIANNSVLVIKLEDV